jgi:hypothetical protein
MFQEEARDGGAGYLDPAISPQTFQKWLEMFQEEARDGGAGYPDPAISPQPFHKWIGMFQEEARHGGAAFTKCCTAIPLATFAQQDG